MVAACVMPVILLVGKTPSRGRKPTTGRAAHAASPPGCGSRGSSSKSPRRRCSLTCCFTSGHSIRASMKADRAAVRGGARAALPVAILAGRRADRSARPVRPSRVRQHAAIGLLALCPWRRPTSRPGGCGLRPVRGLATTVFLSLHSGLTLRGCCQTPLIAAETSGFSNLTNTVPSLIMPWLTIAYRTIAGLCGPFARSRALRPRPPAYCLR